MRTHAPPKIQKTVFVTPPQNEALLRQARQQGAAFQEVTRQALQAGLVQLGWFPK